MKRCGAVFLFGDTWESVDMRMGEKKPYLPVFVGSTFADLQLYRRAVQDALTQLETIVRGMEHFGSKPGRPVDECLRIVESCKVYLGIFQIPSDLVVVCLHSTSYS